MEAYEILTGAKERIFAGNLSKPDLTSLHRRIKARTKDCEDLTELWQLRARLALMIGDQADADVVKARGSEYYISSRTVEAARAGTAAGFDPSSPVRKRVALLVGTGTFQFKRELGVKDLEFAKQDIDRLGSVLSTKMGFDEVATLYGERFTLEEFRKAIYRLREQVEKDDLVLIYVLSHGRPLTNDRNQTSFILTHSSRGSDPAQAYSSSIQVIDLVQELYRELRAQRVILMLDACFSGDAISGQKNYAGHPAPELLDAFTRGSGRVVMAAAGADQISWELPAKRQGAFIHCFAESAEPSATVGEMFGAVKSCVSKEAAALGYQQHPEMFASEGARRIVLGKN